MFGVVRRRIVEHHKERNGTKHGNDRPSHIAQKVKEHGIQIQVPVGFKSLSEQEPVKNQEGTHEQIQIRRQHPSERAFLDFRAEIDP